MADGGTEADDMALDPAHRQALLDDAPMAVSVWRDGLNLYANRAFRELFRVPEGQRIAGMSVLDVIAPEDRDTVRDRVERRRRGETVAGSYPFRALRHDGARFIARAQVRQVALPDGPVSIVLVEDVTELREAEQSLLDSRERVRLAMRGARMGAWSHDLVTNQVEWTPELEEIFGLPVGGFGSFGGSYETFFRFLHPDDSPAIGTAITEALRTRSDYEVEFRFRHASGEWRWMEGRGRAVYGADGTPLRLYGIGSDVTARKQSEQALQEQAESLARLNRVAEREIEERRRAEDALRDADRRKDEFLATLAHELRNPLAPLLNAAHVLANAKATPTQVAWSREVIARQVRHMARLLDDLLDVGRIARGKLDLRRERLSIATALQLALETARPLLAAKGHQLQVDIAPGTPDVDADPVRLAQILGNLIGNAAKYTPAGGHLSIAAAADGAHVRVRLRDDGIGIEPEALPRIFDLFTRAVPAGDSTEGGLGVGLAITRQLVDLHGGTIEASSAGRGHGSEFVLRLPAAAAGAP
jgi:PAS domain S-box-containing protein